jgi:hypothetical protein
VAVAEQDFPAEDDQTRGAGQRQDLRGQRRLSRTDVEGRSLLMPSGSPGKLGPIRASRIEIPTGPGAVIPFPTGYYSKTCRPAGKSDTGGSRESQSEGTSLIWITGTSPPQDLPHPLLAGAPISQLEPGFVTQLYLN